MCRSFILKNGYHSDSFDRFGDDMCEYLLQFLPFEDKMRFECVSRQWKRCVFKKQYEFRITNNDDVFSDDKPKLFNELPIYRMLDFFDHNAKTVNKVCENLLKKCLFVNTVTISDNISNKLLLTIIDNCNHLKWIKFNTIFPGKYALKCYARQKGCPELLLCNYINFISWRMEINGRLNAIKLCPIRVSNANLSDFICADEVLAPKLRELNEFNECDKSDCMDIFVDRYANSIEEYEVIMDHSIDVQYKQLSQLTLLTNLVNLKISLRSTELAKTIASIANIGAQCKKIKYLELKHLVSLRPYSDQYTINRDLTARMISVDILITVQAFSQLTRLVVCVPYYSGNKVITNFTVKLIKNCKLLTHIEIKATITDNFFADIHQVMPQLMALIIETNKSLSDEVMHCLAKLAQLKSLKISTHTYYLQITETGINELTKNCIHMKSLTLKRLSSSNINQLIKIALSYPRISFNYYLMDDFMHIISGSRDVPNNIGFHVSIVDEVFNNSFTHFVNY